MDLLEFYEDIMHEMLSGKTSVDFRVMAVEMDILRQDVEQMKTDISFYRNQLKKYESEKDTVEGLTGWRKSSIMIDRLSSRLN